MEFVWLQEVSGYYQYALSGWHGHPGNISWLQEVAGSYL